MKVLIALMVVASFWPCSVAKADTIEFKNGNKIHGKAIVVTTEVYGRKHLLLKPGKMRVIFKNGGWFEFDASTVKNVEVNDSDEFEWYKERPRPACCHEAKAEAKAEVKVQFKIESTNP